jgi:hypothetical protein
MADYPPVQRERRLGFLCIGVQKAGTTTLHSLLRDHTDLAVSSEKELHFFDEENRDWQSGDYTDYHLHFSDRHGVWGEITPIYIYMPGCLDRVHAYNPDIKLIAMFRDPIDRAFSHWRMEVERGWDAMPFSDAIRDCGRGRLGKAGWHRIFSYVERGFYGQQLAAVLSRFPRRNVLCLDHDLAMSDQASLVHHVAAFVGGRVTSMPGPAVHSHKGSDNHPPPTDSDYRLLASLYARDFRLFKTLSGLGCRTWRISRHLLHETAGD